VNGCRLCFTLCNTKHCVAWRPQSADYDDSRRECRAAARELRIRIKALQDKLFYVTRTNMGVVPTQEVVAKKSMLQKSENKA